MENNPTTMMQSLFKYLPERDIELAEKLLKNRQFIELQEIVNSDVYLAEKNAKLTNPSPRYANLNIEKLNELQGIIVEYCTLIYPDTDLSFDGYEDEEDIEEEEEW